MFIYAHILLYARLYLDGNLPWPTSENCEVQWLSTVVDETLKMAGEFSDFTIKKVWDNAISRFKIMISWDFIIWSGDIMGVFMILPFKTGRSWWDIGVYWTYTGAVYNHKINDWFVVSNSSTMFNLGEWSELTSLVKTRGLKHVETTKQLPVDRWMIRRHRFRAKSGQKHCQEDSPSGKLT
jgi:hypothetical protein